MKKQSGFTLIEIAIVLVIIGLLLGGVLKGQELINSARVKNLATDFRSVPVFIYGYQDKFRALPGDDPGVVAHVNGTPATTSGPTGNGSIGGAWNSGIHTDESVLFWQHVRLAGLAPGSTTAPTTPAGVAPFVPRNALGGRVGVSSTSPITLPAALRGSYYICSEAITGQFAKQLDITFDDGNTATGSMMTESTTPGTSIATASIVDSTAYNVCMAI